MTEIIDRYVAEVGRNLPESSRPDVVRELRSTLEDMLDDRARTLGREPDEDMAVELLKEYGAPYKVASSYLPPRHLIGPQLYPGFETVAKIVIPIILVIALVEFGFSVAQTDNLLRELGELISIALGGTLQAFGVLVLVFGMIERLSPDLKMPDITWDPRSLRPVEDSEERVKVVELAVNTFFTVVAIIVFSLYGRKFGIFFLEDGEWRSIPIFTDVFFGYIPVFVVLWALSIGRDLWVIAQNRWSVGARIFAVALHLLNIGVILMILRGDPIVALGAGAQTELIKLGVTDLNVETVNHWLDFGLDIALILAVIGTVVELGKMLYKLARQVTSNVVRIQ